MWWGGLIRLSIGSMSGILGPPRLVKRFGTRKVIFRTTMTCAVGGMVILASRCGAPFAADFALISCFGASFGAAAEVARLMSKARRSNAS